jgi:hypothetical protein
VKKVLMALGVVVVCLPLVFMGWLLLAARSTKMDAMTARMPELPRSLVVQAMLANSSDAKGWQRATRIDAEAAEEWRKRPQLFMTEATERQTPPQLQEMYKQQVESKKTAKALYDKAEALEKAGQECAAEDIYAEAGSKDTSSEVYRYTEGVGRAGLRCGELSGARAGLEAAIIKQKLFIKGTDEDQLTDVRQDLLKDQEFLIVVYDKQHEAALARQVCSDAHPDWKGCVCGLGKDKEVRCVEKL